MPRKADLWQKSLAPVTWITGFSPVNCDGYHGRLCDSALPASTARPRMRGMSTTSQLSGRTSKPRKARGKLVLHATGSGAAQGFRLRPLQVTWEMTRVCRWKAAFTRSKKDAPREVNHLSTAEAFHLIEDVAAMQVPLLALTGGDPLTRPDCFQSLNSPRAVRCAQLLLCCPHPISRRASSPN